MPITELRQNIKPDYRTDPFSLVLTASGERQRAVASHVYTCTPTSAAQPTAALLPPTLVYHAFQADEALENLTWLYNCGPWAQVIVSFSGSSADLQKLERSLLIDQLIPVANRGRNILPLLQICKHQLSPDTVVLHLHGKRSLPAWRNHLERQLVRDPVSRQQHLQWLAQPNHGVIAPTTFEPLRLHATWEGNFTIARDLLARAYPERPLLSPYSLLSFPAGGMFWFRARVLQRMAAILEEEHFPPEPLPPDRTVAHALERLVFHCCEAEGLQWAFAYQGNTSVTHLANPPGLLEDWRDHYIALLLPQLLESEVLAAAPASGVLAARHPRGSLLRHWWKRLRNINR
jgi:hypothetical protein